MSFWELFFILLIFIPLVMLWVFALVDLFGRSDLSGWAKGLWAIFIVILPLLGLLVYFIARKPTPQEEEAARGANQVQSGHDTAGQLTRLADLHDRGVLTDEEFANEKAKLLGA